MQDDYDPLKIDYSKHDKLGNKKPVEISAAYYLQKSNCEPL